MAQPATTIDAPAGQTVIHGSQIVSFNQAGNLVAEDIQWSKGFASVDFADYVNDNINGNAGAIRRSAYSTTKAIGSMTVQVKSATTVIFPGEFVTFNHPGFTNLKFIVTSVGISYTQNGATKFPVSFAESLSDSVLPQIIALDGNFSQSTPEAFLPCSPIRFSRPFMNAGNNVLMYRQKFAVFRSSWQALPPNSVAPIGSSNFYLIDEEELQDTGVANIVTWDRVYSTKPPSFSEKGSAVKTIKTLMTAFDGTSPPYVLRAVSVRTQTKTIPCDILWDFYVGSPSVGLPDVSDVSVETIGAYTFVNATGGFSWTVNGGGNNAGYRFLQGEIGRWAGNIYYKKEIWG